MTQKRILPEQIANHLRRDILRGKLPAGSSLKERDCAAEMGVSRTPMREAIRILAREGLVTLRPSRSPLVADPGVKEVLDQVVVLVALEQLSAKLACLYATDADIEKIARISEHMSKHFDTTDPLDMFEIDMTFHTSIAKASHNEALARTHGAYLARLWRVRYLAAIQRRSRERVVSQHGDIVEALKSRNAEATLEAINAHLKNMGRDIENAMRDAAVQLA